jgi:hypothetical protein
MELKVMRLKWYVNVKRMDRIRILRRKLKLKSVGKSP